MNPLGALLPLPLMSWTDFFVFRLSVTFKGSLKTKHCYDGGINSTGIEHLDSRMLENIQDSHSSTSDYLRFHEGLACDPLIDLIQSV